jgi:hypothetical protein
MLHQQSAQDLSILFPGRMPNADCRQPIAKRLTFVINSKVANPL